MPCLKPACACQLQYLWLLKCAPAVGEEEDWREWRQKGDPVTHIELRKWADCMLLAPLSANTLAKLAHVRPI